MSTEIYDRVRSRLDELGLTDNDASLAATSGRNRDLIRNLKSGKTKRGSGHNLNGLSKLIGRSVSWILTGDDHTLTASPHDVDWPPPIDPDGGATMGSETGIKGIPAGTSPQIDVTAGMGGGGLTIINPGVPGRHGMTFAAEHVRDYWRLPSEIFSALGLKPTDIAVVPVQGDSMAGTLSDGDFVFIDTRHRHPSPDGLYALTDQFGGIVIKRVEMIRGRATEDLRIRIISDNPRHTPWEASLEEVYIVGRVVRRFGVV